MKKYKLLVLVLALWCCKTKEDDYTNADGSKIFTRLKQGQTGINFNNTLEESEDFDVFRYRNYYNGAGVAIGDINNDGLPDIYLTANSGGNKLYLNQGNFKFKDITIAAGVLGTKAWSTGVSLVDINADGFLDIYVCNSGDIKGDDKENELFINNGNLTFTEKAKQYGLANEGFSTHAVFFDYDKDGDLDCYLLNNSFRPVATLGYRNIRHERDELGGDKLFRNDKDVFTDVSVDAGIYGSVIGFGLGVTVGDVNHDNWPDIYVSNDFFERDYLYINNKNGTFKESLEDELGHCSMFSMGADIADINNDGYLDIFSTDMLPAADYRLKTITSSESYDVHQMKFKNGYYHQYMRNMLHVNNKNGTFSEIGQLAGVSATDWSWGSLIADFDNDGTKEIFVCNGIYRDVTDQDFLEFMANEENIKAALEGRKIDYQKVIKNMPSHKLSNFMFTQGDQLKYKDVSKAWGLDEPSFSNGSAYGDLDNDGDLDLVINNVNQEVFVYRNDLEKHSSNKSIILSFKGADKNTFGVGARVEIFQNDKIITTDQMPIRGYQSSMDYKMIVGVGKVREIDSMLVIWPDQNIERFKNLSVEESLILDQKNAAKISIQSKTNQSSVVKVVDVQIDYEHHENEFNDFNQQRLIYQMLSTQGPALAVGDLNNDGLDDLYCGGASGQSGKIFLQKRNGSFIPIKDNFVFDGDSTSEDVDAVFFDADNDNDLDLYVVSGGSEFAANALPLQDRLYINTSNRNGEPVFLKSTTALPVLFQNGSCVKVVDYDHDNDLDLFVGTRAQPAHYGLPCDQTLLENDGSGKFKNVSNNSSVLTNMGMVTDAQWFDYNNDKYPDLLIVGDFMPVTILENRNKIFYKVDIDALTNTNGWWNRVEQSDLDNDGDVDFVIGNLGWNSKFKPSVNNPVSLYIGDFNDDNTFEPIFTFRDKGVDFPFALKQDLSKEIYLFNKKFIYYRDYADKSMDKIFSDETLKKSLIAHSYQSSSCILLNEGNGKFIIKELPLQAQFAPVYGININDFDGDGIKDIMLGGNLYATKTDIGRYDSSQGLILKGDSTGNFKSFSEVEEFKIDGEVRFIKALRSFKKKYLVLARNNNTLKFLSIK